VYGGSGFFGRLVVEELLAHTSADILVASRNPKYIDFGSQQVRVKFAESVAAPFGTSQGGLWLRVEGRLNGEHRQVEWSIWADQRGERIPAIPAAIAAAMLLADGVPRKGIVSPDWIDCERLVAELSTRGVNVAVRSNSGDPWPTGSAAV
jgi:hypothetical protein